MEYPFCFWVFSFFVEDVLIKCLSCDQMFILVSIRGYMCRELRFHVLGILYLWMGPSIVESFSCEVIRVIGCRD